MPVPGRSIGAAAAEGFPFFLVAIAVTAFASYGLPPLLGSHRWMVATDTWWTVGSARWIASGAIGTVYQANPWWSALPGFPLLLAPVVALGDHLGLVSGLPFPLARPSMWLLVGPFFMVVGASSVFGVGSLADALGVGSGRRRALLLLYGILVVAPTILAGHPEDLAALGLVCWAFALRHRGRPLDAAVVMATAILMQTWAGLALPVLIGSADAGVRWRVAFRAAAVPASIGASLLALDWPHASVDLLGQPMPNHGQHLPWWRLSRQLPIPLGHSIMHVASGSTTRLGAVMAAVLVGAALARRPRSDFDVVAAVALVLLLRGLFEIEVWPYYLAPGAVLVAVAGAAYLPRRRALVVASLSLVLYGTCGGAYIGFAFPALPWFATMAGAAILAFSALGSVGGFGRFPLFANRDASQLAMVE